MPPRKAKQDTSVSVSTDMPPSFPPTTPPSTADEESQTPNINGAVSGITHEQKQQLIDNLQQEITARARRLRAQYAEQAKALRTRLEMRVNRIPKALRERTMADLLQEHVNKENAKPAAALPIPFQQNLEEDVRKSLKRQISTDDDDKENADATSHQPELANPKKRAKPSSNTNANANTANTKATRTASRVNLDPHSVLSPKSHNSRTLPRSPIKAPERQAPPAASHLARPPNPAKPAPRPATAATRTMNRTQTQRSKKAESSGEEGGRSSEASNTSSTTTVITADRDGAKAQTAAGEKKATRANLKAAPAKKPTAKPTATVKKENVMPVPSTGGRSLRKRA